MLLAATSCAALLAGCGSSSTPAGTTASSSTPAIPTPSGSPSSAQIQAAVEECKTIIASESKLPQGAKEKLESACSNAAKGDTAAVKKAAREVCEEVISNSSAVPSADKEKALATCRK
jgi:hypothetical protein